MFTVGVWKYAQSHFNVVRSFNFSVFTSDSIVSSRYTLEYLTFIVCCSCSFILYIRFFLWFSLSFLSYLIQSSFYFTLNFFIWLFLFDNFKNWRWFQANFSRNLTNLRFEIYLTEKKHIKKVSKNQKIRKKTLRIIEEIRNNWKRNWNKHSITKKALQGIIFQCWMDASITVKLFSMRWLKLKKRNKYKVQSKKNV